MREGPLDHAYWERLLHDFPDYQVKLTDGEGRLLGAGHSVPFRWHPNPEIYREAGTKVFSMAVADADAGRVRPSRPPWGSPWPPRGVGGA